MSVNKTGAYMWTQNVHMYAFFESCKYGLIFTIIPHMIIDQHAQIKTCFSLHNCSFDTTAREFV